MDGRTCRVQFSAERVVIAVFAMVRFGMRVSCGAHILKIRLCQRALVWRKRVLGSAAGAEEYDDDKSREDG